MSHLTYRYNEGDAPVLQDGHIVEDGDYETLIAEDGAFADLVRRQQETA
ncbi:MAG: hypothetical protein IJT34_09655 [Butyrivibrio sp.]|nr:hypothetical protein [Butyrivibrio sp.]